MCFCLELLEFLKTNSGRVAFKKLQHFFLVFTVSLHSTVNKRFRVLVKADIGSGLLNIPSSISIEQTLSNLIQSAFWICFLWCKIL